MNNETKMDKEQLLLKVNSRTQLLKLEFFDKECVNCMNTPNQRVRNCGLLRGIGAFSCKVQDKYIRDKSVKANKKDLQEFLINIKRDENEKENI